MAMSAVMIVDENDVPIEAAKEDDGTAKEPFPPYEDDDLNLVRTFKSFGQTGKDELKRISSHVCESFDREWEATEEYRKKMADNWKIFSGFLPAKDWPWANCANINVPIALENTARLAFRMYGELFGDFTNVFGVLPMGPDDKKVAEILTKHGNWQIRNQIIDFPRQMDRATLGFLYIGDITGHSYFDPERGTNRIEVLTPDQFVVPYTYTTTMPDYSDVPFMVKILQLQRHELQARRDDWEGVDEVINKVTPSYDDEPEQDLSDVVAEIQGTEKAEGSKYAPYKILWFEGWMELPNQTRDKYVQVFVDRHTRAVLKLIIHEQPDWQDQRRFDRQMAERDMYLQALDAYEQAVLGIQMEHQGIVGQFDQAATAISTGEEQGSFGPVQASALSERLGEMIPPPPPLPPEPPQPPWMAESIDGEPEPVKRVPVRLFSHAVCIEPLVGSLGFSYGQILADFNRAANTAMNQYSDAATMGNAQCLVVDDRVQFVGDNKGVAPGKILRVTGVSPEEMKNAIMPLPLPPANSQMVEMVQMAMAFAQNAVQAPSVLSGDPGKSGETFRGINARIEQATKQISVVTGKLKEWVVQVLKNNAALNAIHLKEDELFEVTDDITKTGIPLQVSRRMYERDYRVEIRADLRFTPQAQKVQEAQETLQMVMSIPPLQMNPAIVWLAIKNMFEATGKTEFINLLGPMPMPPHMQPPPPPGAVPGAPPPGAGGPPGGGPSPAAPPSPGPENMGAPSPGPANA